MGRPQKLLREELQFLTEFRTLCDVMQQAAVSQLSRADHAAAGAPRVLEFLRRDCLPMLPAAAARHPVFARRPGPRTLVLLSSNEGLVGPLHALAARHAMELAGPDASWILIGQRAVRLMGAARRVRHMPLPSDGDAHAKWRRLAEVLLDEYRRGATGEALLIASRYVSRSRQETAVYPLLPLPAEGIGSALELRQIILEPSLDPVVEHLALTWITATGLEAQAGSRRAEHAARILHMERARDELASHARSLRYEMFKTMHARVDVMVRETCVAQRLAERRRRNVRVAG